jgi:hypothetical protein
MQQGGGKDSNKVPEQQFLMVKKTEQHNNQSQERDARKKVGSIKMMMITI